MNTSTSAKVVSESGSLPWPVSRLLCLLHEDLTCCFLAVARIERSCVTTSQSMGRQEELRISAVQLQTIDYNLHRDECGLFVSSCFHPPFSVGGCAGIWFMHETCFVSTWNHQDLKYNCIVLRCYLLRDGHKYAWPCMGSFVSDIGKEAIPILWQRLIS